MDENYEKGGLRQWRNVEVQAQERQVEEFQKGSLHHMVLEAMVLITHKQ